VPEELDWTVVTAWQKESFGPEGLLGRENKSEVILRRYLIQVIEKRNPGLPRTAYQPHRRYLSITNLVNVSILLFRSSGTLFIVGFALPRTNVRG
jgi:hypothetical protein